MMDELYTSIPYPVQTHSISNTGDEYLYHHHHNPVLVDGTGTGLEMWDITKAQIANHPLYPTLLNAYIDCTKVGAPPEMASLLDQMNHHFSVTTEIGMDPELDHFMKSYCEALHKYKEEISKPFDEATNFLSTIQSQLTDLCTKQTLQSTTYSSQSPGEEEVKEMVMRKYSGYLSSLRKEFVNKRKKGKLPKDAISALLDWWNTHHRWPYPTEGEKKRLSEMTGLDEKQINNWFINQRKRHWRPSATLMADAAGSLYFDPTPRIGT